MNKPQITIKDIARALNVSPSTVSRALKDNPDISKETRDLVHAYAREHNYKPNVLAVNLRASRSNTIGVIVPQLVHHFFSCVLSGIEKAAANAGYNIIVAQSSESYEQEVKIVHSFLAARVCGVIACQGYFPIRPLPGAAEQRYSHRLLRPYMYGAENRASGGGRLCRLLCSRGIHDTDRMQAYPFLWCGSPPGDYQE